MISLIVFMLLATSATPSRAVIVPTKTWTGSGPDGGAVNVIVADPSQPGTLYAGTDRSGIFKTTDHGDTWRRASDELRDKFVWSIAVDPMHSGTLYASVSEPFQGPGSLLKSADGGEHWVVSFAAIGDLAVDSTNPLTVFAGTGEGVLKSSDGGGTWRNTGLTFAGPVAVDPRNPLAVYASAFFGGRSSAIFKSVDGGESWTPKGSLEAYETVFALAIDANDGAIVFAGTSQGIRRSLDGGETWQAVLVGQLTGVNSLQIDPTSSSVVYAASSGLGVLKSVDRGTTWSQADSGLPGEPVRGLAVDSTCPAWSTRVASRLESSARGIRPQPGAFPAAGSQPRASYRSRSTIPIRERSGRSGPPASP